jgi:hypothetical protein
VCGAGADDDLPSGVQHLRIMAGIPDGASVDLSLIKLPVTALMFPAVSEAGENFDFTKPRNPRNFSKEFARKADWLREAAQKKGLPSFGKTRFHDLRGIHSTALLDTGIPVHTVAQRIGDDPAILLRNYAAERFKTGRQVAGIGAQHVGG